MLDVAAAKIGLQCPGVMPPLAKVTSQVCRSIYLTRPPIGKPNLEAAAIRGGLVLDDADAVCHLAILYSDPRRLCFKLSMCLALLGKRRAGI